jgi:hypothetical protein
VVRTAAASRRRMPRGLPITRSRNLRPRKKIRLVFVASATPEHPRLAQCRTRARPYRPAGPARRQRSRRPRPATVDARPTGLLQDSSKILWQTPVSTRPPRTGTPDIHRVSHPASGAPDDAPARSPLRDERASQTTSGRRPLGTNSERQRRRSARYRICLQAAVRLLASGSLPRCCCPSDSASPAPRSVRNGQPPRWSRSASR